LETIPKETAMRAVAIPEAGASPAVVDILAPSPGDGEVLVKVQASSVNGFDVAVAAGMLQGMMEHRFPVVLGKDFAGTVEAVGEGASLFAPGDRVFGVVMKPYLGDGGLGEYLVVGEQYGIARVPEGLDMSVAGVLGLAGAAALDAVEVVAPAAGELVLISGATGGVGALTLQYAIAAGADVVATARPGAEEEFVRGLGAQRVVDYAGDLERQVRAIAPDGVPAIIHLAGDGPQLAGLLAPGGRLVSTLGFGPDQHPAAVALMASPQTTTLDRVAADAASGALQVPITRTYPLEATPQALADFGGGSHQGKLAIAV
jgi:NADPH:quinone reductase-like Zn-dependent oxidoreductase